MNNTVATPITPSGRGVFVPFVVLMRHNRPHRSTAAGSHSRLGAAGAGGPRSRGFSRFPDRLGAGQSRLAADGWTAAGGCRTQRLRTAPGEKREGDGRTPSGIFRLGLAFGRPASLKTGLHYRQATDDDYWVDDPASPRYNQWVRGTAGGAILGEDATEQRALRRWYRGRVQHRTDRVRAAAARSSFTSGSDEGKKATAGCVALRRDNLIALLRWLDAKANPVVVLGTCPPAAEHAPSAGAEGHRTQRNDL